MLSAIRKGFLPSADQSKTHSLMSNGLGVKAIIIRPNGIRSRFYMIQFDFSATATLGTAEVGRCKGVTVVEKF